MVFKKSDNRNQDLILAISIGSKSSACLTRSTGEIISAYKEEHFTGVKNDSSFPIRSVLTLLSNLPAENFYVLTITVTHWFNSKHSDKTWDRYYVDVKELISNKIINRNFVIKKIIESNNIHDCLCETARSYALSRDANLNNGKPVTVIVANRFGNFENVASTYKWDDFDSFLNGEDPEINKLKDFKSSIGMMQQIGSRIFDYLEYDIYRGLMTLHNELPVEKTSSEGLSLYSKQKDWYQYDRYQEPTLYAKSKNTEDLINRAIRKTRDVEDYRPLNVKKLDQLNEKYIKMFDDMDKNQVIKYLQDKSFQALSKLIKPHLDGHIILVGDAFISRKVNESLRNLTMNQFLVCPLLEDNNAIFGATNKILEKIYYNRIDLSDINVVCRYIDIPKYDEAELQEYETKMSSKKLSNYIDKNIVYINKNKINKKDFEKVCKWIKKGNIVNFVSSKASMIDTVHEDSLSTISLALTEKRNDLMLIASDEIDRESFLLNKDLGNRLLKKISEEFKNIRISCTSFVNFDNITPINNESIVHAMINQIEKRDFHNLKNDINLVVIT